MAQRAKRVIAVDDLDYRLEHAKRTNRMETLNFEHQEDTGAYLNQLTKGGADVVIDCVGMDSKLSPVEELETALKLQEGSLGAIEIAVNIP